MYEILYEYGAVDSTPDELYTELFHLGKGYIQKKGEYRQGTTDFKGNPMIYVNDKEKYQGKMKRYILLEDTLLEQLAEARKKPSNLMNPISYYGRKKDKEHADRCFGFIFDIDGIDDSKMHNFIHGCHNYDIYPCPNFIVISKSGKGMHLYYIFDEPVKLFPKTKIQLKSLKYNLIRRMWNMYTSNEENVQFQSYDQSFMVAGTYDTMKVYKTSDRYWNIYDFAKWGGIDFEEDDLWEESTMSLDEAKKKYPDWYEKVIVNGDKTRNYWTCKEDLYYWWLRKIQEPNNGATYGHRYWCVMMLVIYAIKSGVSFRQVAYDAYQLIPYLNSLNPDEPFTKSDVESALDCYESQFATFPIDDISRLSNIEIQKNKRNGRKQTLHLKMIRAIRDISQEEQGKVWYENSPHSGRKSKKDIVQQWKKDNPRGKPKDCIEATGLNKNTVYKWWN